MYYFALNFYCMISLLGISYQILGVKYSKKEFVLNENEAILTPDLIWLTHIVSHLTRRQCELIRSSDHFYFGHIALSHLL